MGWTTKWKGYEMSHIIQGAPFAMAILIHFSQPVAIQLQSKPWFMSCPFLAHHLLIIEAAQWRDNGPSKGD